MNKLTSAVIAVALIVIAVNMTYSNIPKTAEKAPADIEEKVLPVMGRVTFPFDGYGATVGFLVKDGDSYNILRYDEGSMADNDAFQPKYVTYAKFSNGKVAWNPVTVQKFN